MTSIPKPFKFLKDLYPEIVQVFENSTRIQFKKNLADFLSVLSMTVDLEEKGLALKYLF